MQPVLLAANVYGIFSSDPFASKRRDGGKTSGDREKKGHTIVEGRRASWNFAFLNDEGLECLPRYPR